MILVKKAVVFNRFLKCLIISLIILFSGKNNNVFASHASGSDLSYRWVSGNIYEVTVNFYRDCQGVAAPNTVTLNVRSAICNQNFNVTLNRISGTGQEITFPCNPTFTYCNGGTNPGVQQYTFRGNVTIPMQCTDWIFSYSLCCRSCAISTITNQANCNNTATGNGLYVEAYLNNVIANGNSSPTFTNIPLAFLCVNQTFTFNHGVVDTDGDSLVYSFIPPKRSAAVDVGFLAGFSFSNWLSTSSGVSINSATGDITMTPTLIGEVAVCAVLVQEYRSGVLIGSVIRDMQFWVKDCGGNLLPTATGVNGTNNYSTAICPGSTICFSINSDDLNVGQQITMSSTLNIPGATFTIVNQNGSSPNFPVGTFCWTPTAADARIQPYTFTVMVRDNNCDYNAFQIYSFSIFVPLHFITFSSPTYSGYHISCFGGNNGSVTANVSGGQSPFDYLWSNGNTNQTATGLAAGTYGITITDVNGCTKDTSVTLTQPPILNISITPSIISCFGNSNATAVANSTGGIPPYSYLWSNGQTNQTATSLSGGINYSVTITDANNCTANQTIIISQPPIISLSAVTDNISCNGLNNGALNLTVSGGNAPYSFVWNIGSSTEDLSGLAAGNYIVTVTDFNSCSAINSFTISEPAVILITGTQVNTTCGNSNGSIDISITGGTSPFNYLWSNGATTEDISGIVSGSYTVTIIDANNCSGTVNFNLSNNVLPILSETHVNVLCNGNNTGSIDLSVSGGSAPFIYSWSNGATEQDINSLIAGTYSVSVTDNNNCLSTLSINISEPLTVTLNQTQLNVLCNGNNSGSIDLSVSGGTVPYNYSWSNGSTTQDINSLSAGAYSLTVTDNNNCQSILSIIISQAPAITLTETHVNILCNGNNTGSIDLSVSGGTAPYIYSWSNGSTTQDINSLSVGAYSVTVTDNNNCQSVLSIAILQPAPILLNETHVDASCGSLNGSIDLTASGGTSGYTYLWSNGITTQDLSVISAATYSVTTTDANNCTATLSIIISNSIGPILSEIHVNVLCNGNNTGSIDLSVSGGSAPYIYSWSNGATEQDINSLTAGTYSVTVTDNNNCQSTLSINISEPPALTLTETHVNVLCNGNNTGSIDLSVSGGTAPSNYSWSNGSTTQEINSLSAGAYSVTVTDNNNCQSTLSIIISQAPAITLTETHVNILCNGNNTGSIDLSVSGGTTPYNYSWSNGSTTQDINSLTAGTYSVTVTDNNNCQSILSIPISQPAPIVLSETHINASCGTANGSINLTVSGGTAGYSYDWSNGATTEDLSGVSAGTYSLTVTDANNCTSTVNVNISNTSGPILSETHVNVLCNGNNSGSIDLSVSGGTAPYNYSWSNGSTTQDINSLTAGTYSVTVTDFNNCQSSLSINISEPPAFSLSETHVNVLCNGNNTGSIDLSVSGGTSPYNYSWSNGSTTQDIISLTTGTYSVTVTDNNNCQSVLSINISEPSAFLLSETHVNVLCNGNNTGSIDLSVSGGTSPYIYAWSNGSTTQDINSLTVGTYSVTVTDNNNCQSTLSINISESPASTLTETHLNVLCNGNNSGSIDLSVSGGTAPYNYSWSNGSTTQDINSLTAGTYSVTATDNNNCLEILSIVISQPPALTLTETHLNVLCNGNNTGSIDLSVSGGTAPYNYSWSNGSTTQDINSLTAGTYSVTVTDNNNCQSILSIPISQPAPIVLSETHINASCGTANGSINLTVSGGTAGYSYDWSNGATTEDLSGVSAGTYSLTVTDANNCTSTVNVNINNTLGAILSETHLNILCNGNNTGSINLSVSGGTVPYIYSWSNGSTTQDINSLTAGTYSVTVTDNNNCQSILSINISEPPALTLTETHVNVLCNGGNSGSIDLSVTGGTTPYAFVWSNGGTTEDLTGLNNTVYSVTVTDFNGCTAVGSTVIAEPDILMIMDTVVNNVSCFGFIDGGIDITIMGGTAIFSYEWSNGATTEDLNLISGNIYYVTVTDANNCAVVGSFNLNEPLQLTSTISITDSILCSEIDSASINLTVSDGTPSYNYNWSSGAITEDLLNVAAGIYTVTITDDNGCTITSTISVTQPATLVATGSQLLSVVCNGNATGEAAVAATGGTVPYTFSWSTSSVNDTITGLLAATYFVTVTDSHGCTDSTSIIITQPLALDVTLNSVTNVNCQNLLSGAIDINVIGGITAYNYNWSNSSTTQDLTGIGSETYFVTVTDANGCQDTLSIIVNPAISVSVSISADDTISCNNGNNGQLTAAVLSGGTGPFNFLWSNSDTTQTISNLSAGTYSVTVTNSFGCTYVATYQLVNPIIPDFSSGDTTEVCGNNGTLNGTLPNGYTGTWTLENGTGSIDNPNLPVTAVTGLGNTDNLFVWTITNGTCSYTDTATFLITILIADAGSDQSNCDSMNIQLSGSVSSGAGVWSSPDNGIAFTNETDPSSLTTGLTVGQNIIIWTVTFGNCIEIDTLIITVKAPEDCDTDSLQMATGFSPNGDGANDYFLIHGLIHYSENNFSVFNRWGNVVYKKKNYNNEWDGTNNNGDKLPDATYFVVFEAPNLVKPLSGYVDMRR